MLIFLNTGDISSGIFAHNNFSLAQSMPGQAKKKIQKHDILYSEIRPANKHYAYVNIDNASDYIVSTKLMVIRAKDIDSRRLYHYLTSSLVIEELLNEAESRSGTFPQIRFENISNLPMLLADKHIENQFSIFLESIYAIIEDNSAQSRALAALRDTILPKLMSGEIDVSNVKI